MEFILLDMFKPSLHYRSLLSSHKLNVLLDEKMTDADRSDLEDAEAVCRRFLAWNLKGDDDPSKGYVKMKLGQVLGRQNSVDYDVGTSQS